MEDEGLSTFPFLSGMSPGGDLDGSLEGAHPLLCGVIDP
jgi:hypothetical protein